MVFVERKTHRESWKGEESVKERVVLPESKVVPFLDQSYTVEQATADLRAKVPPCLPDWLPQTTAPLISSSSSSSRGPGTGNRLPTRTTE